MSENGSGQTSVTLSTNAKGVVQVDVKVYAQPKGLASVVPVDAMGRAIEVQDEAIELGRIATVALCKAVEELTIAGVPTVFSPEAVASMRQHYAAAVGQVRKLNGGAA